MMEQHHAAAIVPAHDIDASEAFYRRLGFEVVSDHGGYRRLAENSGCRIHLRSTPGWPGRSEDNPMGPYLYVEDVDAVADRVRDLILEPQGPHARLWGTYEFSLSDPGGTLVRIGRVLG
ncbi:VOC family protein [Brevundimonas sp. SL161]|uniref:VOC family protein n=1 Tax=Brevundimonas sp. SL161 TaxID=2804613 RepID=UPI003CF9177E